MNEANVRRLQHLLNKYHLYQTYSVVIDELEDVLATSRRNTSTIMKSLSDLDWIEWLPAVGRSKSSQLTVKRSLQDVILQVSRTELAQGRFTLITKLLETYGHTTVKALALATEQQNQWNEKNNQLLVTQYPWVSELDPSKTFRMAELQVIKSLYDTLIKQDQDGHLQASIAHTWEMKENRFTFWIRPDIRCHDGRLLSIDDVIDSIQRLVNSAGPVEHLFRQVVDVVRLSSQSFQIILKSTNPLFLYALSIPNASIVVKDKIKFEVKRKAFIGTGPFRIQSWGTESIVLQRHDDYFSRKALLQQITISIRGEALVEQMSFNQKDGAKEVHAIDAFSYLCFRYRQNAAIDRNTLAQLACYIDKHKHGYDSAVAVSGVHLQLAMPEPYEKPTLQGTVVLAEPTWTIPYLKDISNWLHQTIQSTGINLELVTLDDISDPSLVSEYADILFMEEVIEQPKEYGVYEWLLTSSGLRFLFSHQDFKQHSVRIDQALCSAEPLNALLGIERDLYLSHHYVPLFWGKDEITRTQQVQGIQVRKTGYSDFCKLWIAQPE
ncbi:ABC transporter substrate-binding protein [Vibrio aestuarianus]|uniref:ABC transporter substrate-binding protein n=1 Tax=Vibrio aestuarianus TaxID=28171 RepID=A0A9X4FH28_9VIBR|nr:ABC transporter substrate-binding protein [Vibrio aestuarianus]MDE1312453.1 ABC transporter substrate-binding protein [Vibrio aestuarianus]MDE1332715.1 ABC transporter substrate-binding protein [Vibrio aestuarianus]MDE1358620.1 ABC transporter substrate-binding protein [Vibrio aestuarianus]NGZ18938.1 ABC transporter substrate-binding protein [Vibrio aestuarianus]NGZ93832.1 ABC transporter substrate-binding protein [Vibrio aestuarianus subsp. cardii]